MSFSSIKFITNKVRLCERSEPQSEPFVGQARSVFFLRYDCYEDSFWMGWRIILIRQQCWQIKDECAALLWHALFFCRFLCHLALFQAFASLSLLFAANPSGRRHLHNQWATPAIGCEPGKAGPIRAIRVWIMFITPPQHEQVMVGRGFALSVRLVASHWLALNVNK